MHDYTMYSIFEIKNLNSGLAIKTFLFLQVVCKSACQKDNVSELENLLKNRFNGLSGN